MNLWGRIKSFFGRGEAAPAQEPKKGFFGRMREAREERKRQREYEKSQRRMAKMEKQRKKEEDKLKEQRRQEEAAAKEEAQRMEAERDRKARETFKDRWGFNNAQYEGFMKFVNAIPREYIEQLGSDTLVEFFRTGQTYNLSPEQMTSIVKQTMATTEGIYAEDIINDLYANLEAYSADSDGGNI